MNVDISRTIIKCADRCRKSEEYQVLEQRLVLEIKQLVALKIESSTRSKYSE